MTHNAARPLVVVHYHWRPGGVRRVIETALPALARRGFFSRVTLAGGEAPDETWLASLRAAMGEVALEAKVFPSFGYRTAPPASPPVGEVHEDCARLLAGERGDTTVWAHNLALGRNAPLASALAGVAERGDAVLLSHHHDVLFDNRWGHWESVQADGFGDLRSLAEAFFPAGPRIAHLCVNRSDHALIEQELGARAVYLPNPVVLAETRDGVEAVAGRSSGQGQGVMTSGRFWLMPCRLMRRKNIAEAVLLARWFAPGTQVVTTGGTASPEERDYASRLADAASLSGWPLRLSVLPAKAGASCVMAWMAQADAVVSTSLREGFGLTAYEACLAGRPLLARATADLSASALPGAVLYDDVMVPDELYDRAAEVKRQELLWERWRKSLPLPARDWAGRPALLDGTSGPAAFSRLTLRAQTELLTHPDDVLCAELDRLNPVLAKRSQSGLPATVPMDGESFTAEKFSERFIVGLERAEVEDCRDARASMRVLEAFLAARLAGDNFYPLLCLEET